MEATAGASSTYWAPWRWKIVSRVAAAAPPAPGVAATGGAAAGLAGAPAPTIASMIESESPACLRATSPCVLVSNLDGPLRIFARMTASERPAFFIAMTESLLRTSWAPAAAARATRTSTVRTRSVFMVRQRICAKTSGVKPRRLARAPSCSAEPVCAHGATIGDGHGVEGEVELVGQVERHAIGPLGFHDALVLPEDGALERLQHVVRLLQVVVARD